MYGDNLLAFHGKYDKFEGFWGLPVIIHEYSHCSLTRFLQQKARKGKTRDWNSVGMHDTENFKKNINEDYDIEEELGRYVVVWKYR